MATDSKEADSALMVEVDLSRSAEPAPNIKEEVAVISYVTLVTKLDCSA